MHGKARRIDRLPLPADVGEAIAAYLRRARPTERRCGRCSCAASRPRAGLTRGGSVADRAPRAASAPGSVRSGRTGCDTRLACDMVAAGVPLPEIGQVLRHALPGSTAIYARVDVDQLRIVARPWPGRGHTMSALAGHVEDYLRLRRALGFKLERPGQVLPQFVAYLDAGGAQTDHRRDGDRLGAAVRGCAADHLGAPAGGRAWVRPLPGHDRPGDRDPTDWACSATSSGATPYLYSPEEIAPLLTAAAGCARRCVRRATRRCSDCLRSPACASARRSRLDARRRRPCRRADHDPAYQVRPRHGWCRCTPAPPKRCAATPTAETGCARSRARDAFFISSVGTGCITVTLHATSRHCSPTPGSAAHSAGRPRIHDLRHSFAVQHPDRLASRRRRRRRPASPCCRPTSGTSARRAPTGTCPPSPELMALAAADGSTDRFGEPAMSALAPTDAGLLHRPAHHQRGASAHTIAATATPSGCCSASPPHRTGKQPQPLDIADLDAPLIAAFLDHLEHERGNSVRTRNNRLAAIHSLFGYAALRHPEHAATIQRVLAIPAKRPDRNLVTYLTERRGRRAAGRPRPRHLARPTRPRHAPARRPDRAADLRARPGSPSPTSTSAPARTCTASAKAARNAPHR